MDRSEWYSQNRREEGESGSFGAGKVGILSRAIVVETSAYPSTFNCFILTSSFRTMAPPPVPANFQTDARVHFDKSAGKWRYEDEEDGQEYEYTGSVWAPVVSTTCGAC